MEKQKRLGRIVNTKKLIIVIFENTCFGCVSQDFGGVELLNDLYSINYRANGRPTSSQEPLIDTIEV